MKTNKNLSVILTSLLASIFFIPSVFAAITITPDIAPGTYDHAIQLHLTPSDPAAKIFYSFNPDGGPNDALLYTGAITLKESTPFVYFGFVSLDNESKVLIDDYIINYPNVSFASGSTQENNTIKGLKITNTQDKDLDLSYWEIRSQDYSFAIASGTLLKPTESYTFPDFALKSGQAALLIAPDEEEKDIIVGISPKNIAIAKPVIQQKKKTFIKSTVRELAPEIWIKPKIEAVKVSENAETSNVASTTETNPIVETPETPIVTEAPKEPELLPAETKSPETPSDINNNLKIAVTEGSSNSTTAPWVILAVIVVAGGVIGTRLFLAKKSK